MPSSTTMIALFVIIQPNYFNGNDTDDQLLFLRKSEISAALNGPSNRAVSQVWSVHSGHPCSDHAQAVWCVTCDVWCVMCDVMPLWTISCLCSARTCPAPRSDQLSSARESWEERAWPPQCSSDSPGAHSAPVISQASVMTSVMASVMMLLLLLSSVALTQSQWSSQTQVRALNS